MCQTKTSPDAAPAAAATNELLPCPFCGKAPDFDTDGGDENGTPADFPIHLVGCLADDCVVNPVAEGNNRAEAIAAWNTRALQQICTTAADPVRDKATAAVAYVLKRIAEEPEIAYRMGAFTQAFDLLTEAHAAQQGREPEQVHDEWMERLQPRRLDADQRLQAIFDIADKTLTPVERKRVYQQLHDEISARLEAFGEEE